MNDLFQKKGLYYNNTFLNRFTGDIKDSRVNTFYELILHSMNKSAVTCLQDQKKEKKKRSHFYLQFSEKCILTTKYIIHMNKENSPNSARVSNRKEFQCPTGITKNPCWCSWGKLLWLRTLWWYIPVRIALQVRMYG